VRQPLQLPRSVLGHSPNQTNFVLKVALPPDLNADVEIEAARRGMHKTELVRAVLLAVMPDLKAV